MKNILYVGEKPLNNNHAGNKARMDIDRILRDRYHEPYVDLVAKELKSIKEKVKFLLSINNIMLLLKIKLMNNKTLILQYPNYYNRILNKALTAMAKNNNTILFVHDVDALRGFENTTMVKAVAELNSSCVLIIHNEKMANALRNYGIKVPMVELELFDYLLDYCPNNSRNIGKEIAFAGNLEKSEFLKEKEIENLDFVFNLYGPNFDQAMIKWNNIRYKGSFSPNVIPYKIEGSFGLIWDGTTIDTCDGPFGNYTRYNNPHKLSLYIAAALPVIVWKESAISGFVDKYNIGFSVNSLHDIDKHIEVLSENTYNTYIKNIKKLQEKVCNGYFTNRALDEVERLLKK